MSIPTKLIDTTIEEFKAEGYTCRTASTVVDNRGANTKAQVVQLIFEKNEEESTNET